MEVPDALDMPDEPISQLPWARWWSAMCKVTCRPARCWLLRERRTEVACRSCLRLSGRLASVAGIATILAGASLLGCGFVSQQSRSLTRSWALLSTPSPLPARDLGSSGMEADGLSSVSCALRRDCVAVGYWASTGAGFHHPLVLRWTGGSWRTVVVSDAVGGLDAVSCPGVEACLAVGGAGVVRIAGSVLASVPGSAGIRGRLTSVSCLSASDCWMVGYGPYGPNSLSYAHPDHVLVYHFDGTALDPIAEPLPTAAGQSTLLSGVSCPGATFCIAVGMSAAPRSDREVMAAFSFDGGRLAAMRMPKLPRGDQSGLMSISCATPTRCAAVGSEPQRSSGPDRTLAVIYDGTSWRVARTPDPARGSGSDDLVAVSCVSSGACVAAGTYRDQSGIRQSLLLRFAERRWSLEPAPEAGGSRSLGDPYFLGCGAASCWDNVLEGIVCAVDVSCVAVGTITYQSDANDQTTTPTSRTLALASVR